MSYTPKVKICGLTRPQDALSAAQAGADAIGLVFYPSSPRNISSLSLAADIASALPPFVSVVGLFVNPTVEFVQQVLQQVPLSLLQFHGDEQPLFCEQFKRPYIKALRMKPDIQVKDQANQFESAIGILLDAYRPGVPGGTGDVFDWQRIPTDFPKPLILAGGLTPDNVAQAVKQVKPWAVDVSGGVEDAPGLKSAAKVQQFIDRAKLALNEKG